MKKGFFYLLAILGINCIIISCHDNLFNGQDNASNNKVELSMEELLSISYYEDSVISETEALTILNNFLESDTEKRSNESVDIVAINKHNVSSELKNQSKPLVYEIKVRSDNTDFIAIVSGDNNFPYVLAYYIDKIDQNVTEGMEPLMYSEEILINNLNYIESVRDSLADKTIAKVSKTLSLKEEFDINQIRDKIQVKGATSTRSDLVTDLPADVVAGNGPFIRVSWDNGMPYNRLMEQSCSDNWLWDYRYPISSAVIATAQILTFFEPAMTIQNTSIDWEYLCTNEEIFETSDYFGSHVADPLERRNMVATLMKYIGEQCQVSYSCSSSSVNVNNVISFLSRYGISMDSRQNMDATKLKASIDNLNPVLMYGKTSSNSGHFWVVDGYKTQEATRSFFPGYNVYMHANMGMGKSYNGYYLVGTDGSLTFNASFAHFNTDLVMYPNIKEK